MFINYGVLENFLKEQKLPTLKETAENPLMKETDPNAFFMVPGCTEEDIRDMPFTEAWDEQKDGAVWVAVDATWDGKEIVDGERRICSPFKKDQDQNVNYLLQNKPFARTFAVKENYIPQLYATVMAQGTWQTFREEMMHGERMYVFRREAEPIDILLLYTMYYEYPSSVAYKALLLAYPENANEGTATYLHFPAYRGMDFVKAYLRDMVTRLTDVRFEDMSQDKNSWLIFPHVTDGLGVSARVRSMLTIASDIYAPSYLSFNLPEVSDESPVAMRRAGVIGAPCFHHKVSFLVKKDQAFPEEYYYSERFNTKNYDRADPEKYSVPNVELPDGYDLRTLSINQEYSDEANNGFWNVVEAAFGAEEGSQSAIINLMPYAVKQINLNEGVKLATTRFNLPKHKIEKKWEPDYAALEGVKLSDLMDVHMIGLFKRKDWLDQNAFYILSESGRWYLSEDLTRDTATLLSMEEMKNSRTHGLKNEDWIWIPCRDQQENSDEEITFHEWFGKCLTGYVFGGGEYEKGYTFGSYAVRLLKEEAKKRGVRIRTMHGDNYLSMMNDPTLIWELVNGKQEFEEYKI